MAQRAEKCNGRKRVLIVDDHPVTSLGIAAMIEKEPDLVVCGKAQDANSALAAVEKLSPDLAVVDVFLHSCGGLNLIKDIKTRRPELAVLVFSIHDESFYAERALRAGARGYISKRESPDQFIKAVREVLNGGIYVGEKTTSEILRRFVTGRKDSGKSSLNGLTDREFQVFQFIGEGLQTRQIAERLHVSVKTIETHREHIKKKLDLDSAGKLAKYAIQWAQMEKGA